MKIHQCMCLSGFGIKVMLASLNELRSFPSSLVFWNNSLRRRYFALGFPVSRLTSAYLWCREFVPRHQRRLPPSRTLLIKWVQCHSEEGFRAVVWRQAVRRELPKDLTLFGTECEKFKPKGAPKNNGDFCGKHLRRRWKMEGGTLPVHGDEASSTLMPKPDKDTTRKGSYRPVSLMQMGVKILNKILAN
ncbi:DNA repair protein XRCC2 isoform X3 [Manis pentadactyla]|uniref:DNA repair protein XRCC2 isoform X3 n=1 Tax=Manis pentadactyla TaxID=143292 RepID=UPI00255CD3E2|nr:DNA repair protein XRCC2 isoform X3 [Manis pentadactyla]